MEEASIVRTRTSRHGLKVGPGGLLDQAVADGDLAGLVGGGGGRSWGIDDAGGEEVLEGGVGRRFDEP